MIKLTVLNYKIKHEALERRHKISEHYAKLIYNWEEKMNTVTETPQKYVERPFVEPFEFEDDDYEVTELNLRIKKEEVIYYKENMDNLVEVTIEGGISFVIKEKIGLLDAIFCS